MYQIRYYDEEIKCYMWDEKTFDDTELEKIKQYGQEKLITIKSSVIICKVKKKHKGVYKGINHE